LGNAEKMKRGFHGLALVKPPAIESDDLILNPATNEPIDDHDVFNEDELRSMARERYLSHSVLCIEVVTQK
jgi:intraflagellar transport protein 88